MNMYARPIIIPPIITYCLRLPHLDFVLSEINPIIGSRKASKILGNRKTPDHINPVNPRSSTKTIMKIPKIAGNI